jgi:PII-like signaling protein
VNDDCLKLTVYFGERERVGRRFLADALVDRFAANELQISIVMRGVTGFGSKHHLHTDRLLTLSEDLPLVAVAVDARERIEATLAHIREIEFQGLVTLERARLLTGRIGAVELPAELHEATKLTVYVGRNQRVGPAPAYEAIVALLHRNGIAGATVLLGVDGTAHGVRRRARFFAANADVPLMVIAVGDGHRIASLLPELGTMLANPLVTLERVRVCKRDGVKHAEPLALTAATGSGLGVWQKLMVYASGQARHEGRPMHVEVIRRLREAGAAGATSLRGIWGYHGDHEPHGDVFWQLQRRVAVVTVVVDTPERTRRWFEIVDELTDETGLVTSEMVPGYLAIGPGFQHGGLRLARPRPGRP